MSWTAFVAGFTLCLTLIFAIGAQNAFVLKQGLRREYVFELALICALSDAILISTGVWGFSWAVAQVPRIEPVVRYAGAAFLLAYAAASAWAACTRQESLQASDAPRTSRRRAVLVCLALTWLNPHVYLDTMLIGSVGTQYPGAQGSFAAGAVCTSFLFFFSLGYGARLLAPIFRRPSAWRVLHALIAVLM
ncbi:MAG: amino acid transporter, partial [Rhodocyclaceae bacterium]|nr:amino acid transporter [Rhodocyclaceae bacterium]